MYKILIVDDEVDMAETIRDEIDLFLDENVTLTLAFNGKEALDLTLSEKFNLIITDFKMPRMNGVEFITQMKTNSENENKNTPVIFISAFIPDVKGILSLQEGTIFIEKPYVPQSFRRNIKMMLGAKS